MTDALGRNLMKTFALLLTPCFPWLLGSTATYAQAEEEHAAGEVMAVIDAFNKAFAENDVETYFSMVDEEIVVITPGNPYRVDGIRDDREEFEYSLEAGRTRVAFWQTLDSKVQLHGNVAIVTLYIQGVFESDVEKTLYLKITDVLARKGNTWKIVHIHVSEA